MAITVDRFLGYKLESGGLFVGYWFWGTFTIILTLASIAAFVVGLNPCDDLQKYLEQYFEDFQGSCIEHKKNAVYGLIAIALVAHFFGWMAWFMIKGIKKRNHRYIFPMMVFFAILALFCAVAGFMTKSMLLGGFFTIMYGYNFIATYSIYDMFKREKERGATADYRQPGSTV